MTGRKISDYSEHYRGTNVSHYLVDYVNDGLFDGIELEHGYCSQQVCLQTMYNMTGMPKLSL